MPFHLSVKRIIEGLICTEVEEMTLSSTAQAASGRFEGFAGHVQDSVKASVFPQALVLTLCLHLLLRYSRKSE